MRHGDVKTALVNNLWAIALAEVRLNTDLRVRSVMLAISSLLPIIHKHAKKLAYKQAWCQVFSRTCYQTWNGAQVVDLDNLRRVVNPPNTTAGRWSSLRAPSRASIG